MWTKGKYVVGEVPMVVSSGMCAVIIDEAFDHAALRGVFIEGTIRSAGFFHVQNARDSDNPLKIEVKVYGESRGLQKKSLPEDQKLLEKALGVYESPYGF